MEENTTQKNYKDSKVLRTYTSDMADAIRTDEVSVIKIALAEKEKREREAIYKKAEGTKTSKIFFVICGVILIAGAIIGSYLLIQKKKERDTPPTSPKELETFITYNASSYIDVTNTTNIIEFMDAIKSQEQNNPGLIKAIFLTQKTNNISELLKSKDFFSKTKINVPGSLIRSLSDKYLFGKYYNQGIGIENNSPATFIFILYTKTCVF